MPQERKFEPAKYKDQPSSRINLVAKLPKRLRYPVYAGMITAAVGFLTACGGNGEVNGNNTDNTPTEPVATAPMETPTVPASPTPENKPMTPEEMQTSVDKIAGLIREGFTKIDISDPHIQLPLEYKDPEKIINRLKNCISVGQPIMVPGPGGKGDISVGPGDSHYYDIFLGQCEQVGDSTSQIFELTQEQEFRQANQDMEVLHRSVWDQVAEVYPVINDANWQRLRDRIYNLN